MGSRASEIALQRFAQAFASTLKRPRSPMVTNPAFKPHREHLGPAIEAAQAPRLAGYISDVSLHSILPGAVSWLAGSSVMSLT